MCTHIVSPRVDHLYLPDLQAIMAAKGYTTIADFQGKLRDGFFEEEALQEAVA